MSLELHKDFKLSGNNFESPEKLLEFSKTISSNIHSFLIDWFDSNAYVVVNTSGSTGIPKAIQLKKVYMINSALATGEYFDIKEKTTALLCLSTDYIAGKMMLIRAMILGWHLDVISPVSSPLKGFDRKYDFSAMVPIQLYNSLDKLNSIKKVIVGGGVVSKKIQEKLKDLPTQVYATYGMTETITHIAIKKLNNLTKIISNESDKSYFQVLPNIKISKDSRECLVIDAPKLSDKQIITNDLIELISDTEFKWLGRYDSIVNSGGIKLIPEQIETILSEIIDDRFFVAGVPDAVLGEKLILIIESNVTSSEAINLFKSQISSLKTLSKYGIPKEIYLVSKFIETETKKIQRRQTLDLIFKGEK